MTIYMAIYLIIYLPSLIQLSFTSPADETTLYLLQRAFHSAAPCMNPLYIEDIRKMQGSEMRMLRWMIGVSLSERKSNECVRNMLAIDDIAEVMRQNRLRWFGYIERRDELRIETLQVDGNGVKVRPKKRWREVLREETL